jgi:hypothetical protein
MPFVPRNHADKYAGALLAGRVKPLALGDNALFDVLNHSVVRVLTKVVDLSDPGTSVDIVFRREFRPIIHVRDWLKAALFNDVPWLRNLDDTGRPKKLVKCRDLNELVREADKDMRKQNAAIVRKPLAQGEEALVFACADGWSIVRLITPAALDRESVIMQHCIGNGAYDDRLADDRFRYLSLRDPAGNPHGTMEIDGKNLIQFQGKQNATPLEKYVQIALSFFVEQGIDCNEAGCGLVTDADGLNYFHHELPERLVVKTERLTLRSTPERKIKLPKFIHTTGSLELVGVFENIPERLLIEQDLEIVRLDRKGELGTTEHLSSFDVLPSKIHVFGDCRMRQLPMSQLPSDMRVEGHLDVAGTGIKSLPSELRCGSIDICYTDVTEFDTVHFIPEEQRQRGRRVLEARFSKLEKIVGEPIFHRLELTASKLAELPAGLIVTGDLSVDQTSVTVLPEDMTVGGSLRADMCSIRCLPSFLNVKGGAYFDRSVVGMPMKFSMPGTLLIRWGVVEVMAQDIEAENIILLESKLPGLPARIRTGQLNLDKTSVRTVEGDVVVRQLDVCEDFQHLGPQVRISGRIEVHCRARKEGPCYCIAELTEGDARAMLKDKGVLEFRKVTKLPKIRDLEFEAAAFQSFKRIFAMARQFGATT